MKVLPGITKIIIGLTVILLLLQVLVANRLTNVGLSLRDFDDQEQRLSEENEILERKIATFSSLTQIAKRATEMGFAPAKTYYLSPEFSVAGAYLNGAAR